MRERELSLLKSLQEIDIRSILLAPETCKIIPKQFYKINQPESVRHVHNKRNTIYNESTPSPRRINQQDGLRVPKITSSYFISELK